MLGVAIVLAFIIHFGYKYYLKRKQKKKENMNEEEKNKEEKGFNLEKWESPYIMGSDLLENPTDDIIPLVTENAKSIIYIYIYIRSNNRTERKHKEGD